MALDKEFFDAIDIELVKKKYYNANKVHALLGDIRAQAEALSAENARLKEELSRLSDNKAEISETLISAQALAKQLVDNARQEADSIVREAAERRDAGGFQSQEQAALCVERCIERLKRQQLDNIDVLNGQWQDFLCGLAPAEKSAGRRTEPVQDAAGLSDLEARVNAIAKELREISAKS